MPGFSGSWVGKLLGLAMVLMLLAFARQTLCETLHSENKELRTKLERDLEQRNQALEKLR